jgi:phosphatidylserine synthase
MTCPKCGAEMNHQADKLAMEGIIALQLHRGFQMVVEFKDINLKQPHSWRVVVLMAVAIMGVLLHPQIALLTVAALYVTSGMAGYAFGRRKPHPAETPVIPPVAEQPKAN